jgi:tripartite-type tricarboxylate transporter receptor subunit TctC
MLVSVSGSQILVAASIVALLGTQSPAGADSVEDFYRGKTVTIMVGASTGGGYDGDARVVARNIARHIPGNPTVIVQNLPGARGMTSVNSLYNLVKRDGTFMGMLEREHLIDAYLMPEGVRYDERKFNWIGSIGSEQGVAFGWHTARQRTVDDIRKSEMIVGGYSNSAVLPFVYNATIGTKFKVIKGYTGSGAVLLAVEKGEVQGIANHSLSNILARHLDWFNDHKINIFFQTGQKRDAALPSVPLVSDFALDEEKRRILHLWLAPSEVARPMALPPEVPADRVSAMRKAFMALFDDPQFLSDAKKIGMPIDPKEGAYIQTLVNELRALPPNVIAAAKAAAGESGGL